MAEAAGIDPDLVFDALEASAAALMLKYRHYIYLVLPQDAQRRPD